MRKKTLEFLALLHGVKETPSGWKAFCPVHKGGQEAHPSLEIKEGNEGIVFTCRSHGCSYADVCRAIGWEPGDLFWSPLRNGKEHGYVNGPLAVAAPRRAAAVAATASRRTTVAIHSPPDRERLPPTTTITERLVAEHVYQAADGAPLLKVRRLHRDDPSRRKGYRKACIPFHPKGEGWERCDHCKHETPLYRLPELLHAPEGVVVAWVEGENKVDALVERGVFATTALGGSGRKNQLPDLEPLRGKKVCILPDKDDPGDDYARHVFHALQTIAQDVWITSDYPGEDAPPAGYDVVDWLAEQDGDLDLLLAEREKRPPEYKLLTVRELLALPSPLWQIVDLIQEQSLWLLFGESGHGKSFVAMDLLANIARGNAWCGKAVNKAGPVVYINADGGMGFRDRLNAWCEANEADKDNLPFYTLNDMLPISDPGAVAEFSYALSFLPEKPAAIFVDTYSRCIPGKDENNQGESSMTIRNLDALRKEWGCSVGVAHHTEATGRRVRGSSVLIGAVDTALRVTRNHNHVSVEYTKQRNGRDDLAGFEFNLRPVAETGQVCLWQTGVVDPVNETMRQENDVEAVIADNPNCTSSFIATETGLNISSIQRRLASLHKQNRIEHGPPLSTRGREAFTYRIKE